MPQSKSQCSIGNESSVWPPPRISQASRLRPGRLDTPLSRVMQSASKPPMKMFFALTALLMLATPSLAAAQDAAAPESRRDFRYALAVIDDATFDSNLQ